MKRTIAIIGLIVGIVGIVGLVPPLAEGQSTTPSTHPLVGAWVVEAEGGLGLSPHFTIVFHADGTVVATDEQGITWLGAWETKNDRRAAYAVVSLFPLESPLGPGMTYVGHVEVDESGDHFSRSVTSGPQVEGTRITPQ